MGQYNYPDKAPKFLRAEDLQLHKMLDYKQQQVVKFHLITVISRTVHKHLIKIQRQNDVFVKHWIHPRQWQRFLWMWPWPLIGVDFFFTIWEPNHKHTEFHWITINWVRAVGVHNWWIFYHMVGFCKSTTCAVKVLSGVL